MLTKDSNREATTAPRVVADALSGPGLYVVATPIGHLSDLSPRAQSILASVDLIAAEDTRHTRVLLRHYGIQTPVTACHEHNEKTRSVDLVRQLEAGKSIALVSDAGTPLVSDPGFRLVNLARDAGLRVTPVPGPCALIAALSVSGLPSDRFFFEGFLPARSGARRKRIDELADFPHTWILYESPHRVVDCLSDMEAVLGDERRLVLARELTKRFETVCSGTAAELLAHLEADANMRRGEFVLLVQGAPVARDADALLPESVTDVLAELVNVVPVRTACQMVSQLTGLKSRLLYKAAIAMKQSADNEAPRAAAVAASCVSRNTGKD